MLIYDLMAVSNEFTLELIRDNEPITIKTKGFTPSQLVEKDTYNIRQYKEYNSGHGISNEVLSDMVKWIQNL